MDKINRLAENLGIDEDFAAAVQAHLEKTRGLPPDGPGEAEGEGEGAEPAGSLDFIEEANAPHATHWGG
jgi:hypothetical protein